MRILLVLGLKSLPQRQLSGEKRQLEGKEEPKATKA